MRLRWALAIGISLLALTGCASSAQRPASPTPDDTSRPTASASADAAAQAQAQAWLDAAALPPGAYRALGATGFDSYQGWPCRPVVELRAYWTIPDSTVADAAEWLAANPTADLVSNAVGHLPEDVDETIVGDSPADGSQQGVVYTVVKAGDGVAVRAEIAALAATAVCPSLPPGETMGKPGQG
jgi:hypothetical protein